MATNYTEELAHYGVLGMKWGVRKQSGRSTGSSFGTKVEKAAKTTASAAKKVVSSTKKAAGATKKTLSSAKKRYSEASAEHARKKAEAARKKLEKQKLREARQTKKAEAKKAKESKKQAKLEQNTTTPKGGLTRDQRNAKPRDLATTDLIEQNKRLQLEKTNSELKAKLAEYEKENRSQFAKLADTFVSEASSNLTKYAAKKASDMLIGAIDSNLSLGSIKGLAKEADRATGLSEVVKKKDKK